MNVTLKIETLSAADLAFCEWIRALSTRPSLSHAARRRVETVCRSERIDSPRPAFRSQRELSPI